MVGVFKSPALNCFCYREDQVVKVEIRPETWPSRACSRLFSAAVITTRFHIYLANDLFKDWTRPNTTKTHEDPPGLNRCVWQPELLKAPMPFSQPTSNNINPLKPELIPICYLLALLGAHHFLHVSRIRVKLLTFRRLMSYIYIYGAPILDVSRSHTTTQHSR